VSGNSGMREFSVVFRMVKLWTGRSVFALKSIVRLGHMFFPGNSPHMMSFFFTSVEHRVSILIVICAS